MTGTPDHRPSDWVDMLLVHLDFGGVTEGGHPIFADPTARERLGDALRLLELDALPRPVVVGTQVVGGGGCVASFTVRDRLLSLGADADRRLRLRRHGQRRGPSNLDPVGGDWIGALRMAWGWLVGAKPTWDVHTRPAADLAEDVAAAIGRDTRNPASS